MGTIKATVLNGGERSFTVHGYGKPMESVRWGNGYVQRLLEMDSYQDIWYLNSNGYAQLLDPAHPPFSGGSLAGYRLLLIPNEAI